MQENVVKFGYVGCKKIIIDALILIFVFLCMFSMSLHGYMRVYLLTLGSAQYQHYFSKMLDAVPCSTTGDACNVQLRHNATCNRFKIPYRHFHSGCRSYEDKYCKGSQQRLFVRLQ